eukprot:6908501-Alexandrium_andersonii.AAC.1
MSVGMARARMNSQNLTCTDTKLCKAAHEISNKPRDCTLMEKAFHAYTTYLHTYSHRYTNIHKYIIDAYIRAKRYAQPYACRCTCAPANVGMQSTGDQLTKTGHPVAGTHRAD